ncbi:hypothetical protein [Sphingomonas sp. RIT328]|uniref:hypothetical protein n=1 Tax=Sphingomonas sp. RIT328 TaxID=1470591 RepID=UPI00129B924C|nr:hypothetical protein [Sphingomonas sp. RIT328]
MSFKRSCQGDHGAFLLLGQRKATGPEGSNHLFLTHLVRETAPTIILSLKWRRIRAASSPFIKTTRVPPDKIVSIALIGVPCSAAAALTSISVAVTFMARDIKLPPYAHIPSDVYSSHTNLLGAYDVQ